MSAGCLAQPMDQPGGGLPTQPFGDQPLVQPDPPGQLVGPDRLLRRVVSGQFAIEAEAITDVDGQGHHLAHLVAPHGEGKGVDGVGVESTPVLGSGIGRYGRRYGRDCGGAVRSGGNRPPVPSPRRNRPAFLTA